MGRVASWIVGIMGVIATAVFAVFAAAPWLNHVRPLITKLQLEECILNGSLTLVTGLASWGIFAHRLWGWWITVAFCLLLLGFDGWLFWSATHQHNPYEHSESGFGVGLCLIVFGPPAFAMVLLMLKSTRALYFTKSER